MTVEYLADDVGDAIERQGSREEQPYCFVIRATQGAGEAAAQSSGLECEVHRAESPAVYLAKG
jgi:hypothetical protein